MFLNGCRYDECYPGGLAELSGGWDSDDEEEKGPKGGKAKAGGGAWEEEEAAKHPKVVCDQGCEAQLRANVLGTGGGADEGKLVFSLSLLTFLFISLSLLLFLFFSLSTLLLCVFLYLFPHTLSIYGLTSLIYG